jgi:hypothetical protein
MRTDFEMQLTPRTGLAFYGSRLADRRLLGLST